MRGQEQGASGKNSFIEPVKRGDGESEIARLTGHGYARMNTDFWVMGMPIEKVFSMSRIQRFLEALKTSFELIYVYL